MEKLRAHFHPYRLHIVIDVRKLTGSLIRSFIHVTHEQVFRADKGHLMHISRLMGICPKRRTVGTVSVVIGVGVFEKNRMGG